MAPATIIFEQPLNEQIRFYLLIEHLFQKIDKHIYDDTSASASVCLETILEILIAIDRPDLKTKLTKNLTLYKNNLSKFSAAKAGLISIDEKKLRSIAGQLEKLVVNFSTNTERIGQSLRDNEFIKSILQYITKAGGTSAFNVPAYHLWLKMPKDVRTQNIIEWQGEIATLKNAIYLLLRLTREGGEIETFEAQDGFFQLALDQKIPYQLVRVSLPVTAKIYPKISLGRHRLTLHLFALDTSSRSKQITENVKFGLACCKI